MNHFGVKRLFVVFLKQIWPLLIRPNLASSGPTLHHLHQQSFRTLLLLSTEFMAEKWQEIAANCKSQVEFIFGIVSGRKKVIIRRKTGE